MFVFFSSRKTVFKSNLDTSSTPGGLIEHLILLLVFLFLDTYLTPYLLICSSTPYLLRCSLTLSWHLLDTLSVELYEIQFFRYDFRPMLMCLCRVSFVTTLDIYKAYFRGCHRREYKENICKRWPMPNSLKKKLLRLCILGFCNQVLLDLHCFDEVKNFVANNLLLVGD